MGCNASGAECLWQMSELQLRHQATQWGGFDTPWCDSSWVNRSDGRSECRGARHISAHICARQALLPQCTKCHRRLPPTSWWDLLAGIIGVKPAFHVHSWGPHLGILLRSLSFRLLFEELVRHLVGGCQAVRRLLCCTVHLHLQARKHGNTIAGSLSHHVCRTERGHQLTSECFGMCSTEV